MLKAVELSRHYGEVHAADEVSFDIDAGEIVGLLGHNGAGKTTVMKLLTGYIEPTAGAAFVNDINVHESPVEAQACIGYLPESSPLYAEMTVADYLMFVAAVRGIPREDRIESVKQVLADTDLQERLADEIGTLSRGYRQRVAVAQAILHAPPVLILDEPTNGLDPSQTVHMRKLIERLATKSTVILSTHIMQEVNAICDRVLILNDGQLVVDEQLDELNRAKRIALRSAATTEAISQATGESVHPGEAEHEHLIDVAETANVAEQINALTRKLVNAGIDVNAITPERYDLETLFASVSRSSDDE